MILRETFRNKLQAPRGKEQGQSLRTRVNVKKLAMRGCRRIALGERDCGQGKLDEKLIIWREGRKFPNHEIYIEKRLGDWSGGLLLMSFSQEEDA